MPQTVVQCSLGCLVTLCFGTKFLLILIMPLPLLHVYLQTEQLQSLPFVALFSPRKRHFHLWSFVVSLYPICPQRPQ